MQTCRVNGRRYELSSPWERWHDRAAVFEVEGFLAAAACDLERRDIGLAGLSLFQQQSTEWSGQRALQPWTAHGRGHRREDCSLNDTWEECQMTTAHSMNTGSEYRSAERAIRSAAVKGAIGTRAKTANSDKTLRQLVRWCPCPAGDHLLLQRGLPVGRIVRHQPPSRQACQS